MENFNYSEMTAKWFELANESYRTYIKSLVWNQERTLDLTRQMLGQTDATQGEGRNLAQEYASQWQRGQQLVQNMWQESFKASTDMMNQYRVATNANLSDLTQRLDNLQARIEIAKA